MTLTELLESVRRVEVRTNRLVNDTMAGESASFGEPIADFCALIFDYQHVSNGCSLSQRERVRVRENAVLNLQVRICKLRVNRIS